MANLLNAMTVVPLDQRCIKSKQQIEGARDLNERHYSIGTMSRAALDLAVDWAASEGWNPGLHDADAFHAADPGGFLIGRLDGEPVSMISAVRYGSGFGFIGFYIVHAAYRGRGYGLAIWKAAMQRLQGRNVGLDGVIEQQANYRKSGFNLAYRNVRFAGNAAACMRPVAPELRIVEVSALPRSTLIKYDNLFFPDDREAFLDRWIAPSAGRALACMKGDVPCGYGVIRLCRTGYKIGPLFADSAAVADGLLSSLCANLPHDAEVFLDVPEVNSNAIGMAEGRGMSKVFETARMYTGDAPDIPVQRVFGVTTFELG